MLRGAQRAQTIAARKHANHQRRWAPPTPVANGLFSSSESYRFRALLRISKASYIIIASLKSSNIEIPSTTRFVSHLGFSKARRGSDCFKKTKMAGAHKISQMPKWLAHLPRKHPGGRTLLELLAGRPTPQNAPDPGRTRSSAEEQTANASLSTALFAVTLMVIRRKLALPPHDSYLPS